MREEPGFRSAEMSSSIKIHEKIVRAICKIVHKGSTIGEGLKELGKRMKKVWVKVDPVEIKR